LENYDFIGEMEFIQYLSQHSENADSAIVSSLTSADSTRNNNLDSMIDQPEDEVMNTTDKEEILILGSSDVQVDNGERKMLETKSSSLEMKRKEIMVKEEPALPLSLANIVVNSESGATVYEWDFDTLCKYFQGTTQERNIANALLAYISHELQEKLTEAWHRLDQQENQHVDLSAHEKQVLLDFLGDALGSKNSNKGGK
jgi:hypothetical protein